ncbi:MAG: iron ABC transporter permease [Oscillospiraceae bacterium]|nr:iron ABC transporter permease [Oscillospiraceae bacterium]
MNKNKLLKIIISACILIFLTIFLSTIGSVNIPINEIFSSLIDRSSTSFSIIYLIRLPRNILAVIVGMSLSVSGVLLQAVMKNPLSDPGITGVSSGATLMGLIVMLALPSLTPILSILVFLGGFITCVIVYTISWKNGISPIRVILAGISVNSILGAGISLLSIIFSDKIQSVLLWLNGSLAGKSWESVQSIFIYIIIGLILAVCFSPMANILSLSDETVSSLGFNINIIRLILSSIAVLLASITTSVVGIIGFIGLVVPHISRLIIGSDHKYLIPFSMILGGILLLGTDTISRTIIQNIELPVGIIMSIIGGPFFLYLLRKKS